MFGTIGWQEILLILLIVLLLFGPKRIPEFARAMGKGVKEFRDAMRDFTRDSEEREEKNKKASP